MIPEGAAIAGVVLASYLLGAVPVAYIYGKFRGVDIRTQGSGNPGATNVARLFGIRAGLVVLALDMLKGLAAAQWLALLAPASTADWIGLACGLAAILGHTFTIFLGFKGGKGVATACGVFAALAPYAAAVAVAVFVLVVWLTRYVSAGSMLAAVVFPGMVWVFDEAGKLSAVGVVASLVAVMILARHRSNVSRILAGTENKFGGRPQAAESKAKKQQP